jgi:lipid-binding SYLF domain-containing protein
MSSQQSRGRHSPNIASNLENSSLISFSASKSRSSSNDNISNYSRNHDDHIDEDRFDFDLDEDELKLPPSISSKITNHVSRTDPSGKAYTSYIIQVHTVSSQTSVPMTVEHRYSEFARLQSTLAQYNIEIDEPFPKRHWAGRLGNWTPSSTIAPQRHADLIADRTYQLNAWLEEVTSKYPKRAHQPLPLEFKLRLWEFLSKSSTEIPPCDRENELKGNDTSPFLDESDLMLENQNLNQSLQMSITAGGKAGMSYLANPLSFTLGSAIRQAAHTVRTMCSSTSTLKIRDDASDQAIPLDLLHSARGLVFLTVAKGGFILSVRGGTGLIIVRKRGTNLWSAPSALGTVGMGWGALIGGDITTYLIVLNTEEAVKAFIQPSGTVNLGAELGVAVGPLGRGAGGNVGTGSRGGVVPAYAYAHSKGLFAGISFEGSLVACRPDVNSKFYGRPVKVHEILFGTKGDGDETPIHPPRAAQTLYDALFDAMNMTVPEKGFRPSRILQA